jgi:hypothetical protein
LGNSRRLLDEALANGGDNSLLFRLSVNLRRWRRLAAVPDSHMAEVHRQWGFLQKVYLLEPDRFNSQQPTVLFIHGSGVGPFPVFNALFKELQGRVNAAFFLYDNLEPLPSICRRLEEAWGAFRVAQGISTPHRIVTLSYGTTVFRLAVLTRENMMWQGARLVEIAPLVLGSSYAKLFNAFPLQKAGLKLMLPNLKHLADGVDGKGAPQELLWSPENIARFDAIVPHRLSLMPEKDEHLSREARRKLPVLLGPGRFKVIAGAHHAFAPGLPEVLSQTREFLAGT